jgi:hypothetical protein
MSDSDGTKGAFSPGLQLIMNLLGIVHSHSIAKESDQVEDAMDGAVTSYIIELAIVIISPSLSDSLS